MKASKKSFIPDCDRAGIGWRCLRLYYHNGGCVESPRWWNWSARARRHRALLRRY